MPLTFRRLNTHIAHLSLDWMGESVQIAYRKGEATPLWLDSFARKTVRRMLAEVLESWDILGDDGQPLQPPLLDEDAPESVAAWNALAQARAERLLADWRLREAARAEAAAEVDAQAQALGAQHPPQARPDGRGRGRAVPPRPTADASDPAPAPFAGTREERRHTRIDLWDELLGEFPQDFLRYLLNKVVEDLVPGK